MTSFFPELIGVCVNMVNSCICSFTYKVVVEIEEAPDKNFECVGSPQMKKKAAAENAAEGALWYLKHELYLS